MYVFELAGGGGRKGKIVVRVDYSDRLSLEGQPRGSVPTNSLRSAGYVQPKNLGEARYEVLDGALE